MAPAGSTWCLRCLTPRSGVEACPACEERPVLLAAHKDAESSAERAFELLKGWQRAQARVQGTEGFMVVPNRALAALAVVQPETKDALVAVPGIGPKKARDYGPVLLRFFRARHEGRDEPPLLARAPMPEGLTEEEQAWVLELREAEEPLSKLAARRGLALEEFLDGMAALVEKGAVDLPHRYCSPAELAWILARLEKDPALDGAALRAEFPEASPVALALAPALSQFRRQK
ncbi:MAG: HRDC domain-containing protein [Methanobacteriota archaeon]